MATFLLYSLPLLLPSLFWVSLVAQLVQNLPAKRETWVQSLGWDDPVEKRTATHTSILARRIPWATVHGVAETKLNDFHFKTTGHLSLSYVLLPRKKTKSL